MGYRLDTGSSRFAIDKADDGAEQARLCGTHLREWTGQGIYFYGDGIICQ